MITSKTITENIDLFRIMPLERFLQFLYTKENVLVRPSKWKDPYESLIKKSFMMLEPGKKEPFDDRHWYGQCWSNNPNNDAMWRIYTKGKDSRAVMIRTKSDDLKAGLSADDPHHHFFLECVAYAKQAKGENDNIEAFITALKEYWEWGEYILHLDNYFKDDAKVRAISLFLTKRAPFKFEEEVRLICYSKEPQEDEYYKYPIKNLGDFIQEVVLDPWTPEGVEEAVLDIVRKYIPDKNIAVTKSDLYKEFEGEIVHNPYGL